MNEWQSDTIAALRQRISELEAEREQLAKKLAVIFDLSTYADSYGVEGSSFRVCRWCGGGSGPGGNPPFKHNPDCLMDDDLLEAKVKDVWEITDELQAEIDELQQSHAKVREQALEEARLAYESHIVRTFGGDENCEHCGDNWRSKIHLRVGETTQSRIRALIAAPKGEVACD